MSIEKRAQHVTTWSAWKIFLSNLAQSYIDFFYWVKHLFFPLNDTFEREKVYKKVLSPYGNSLRWFHRLLFPQRGTTTVLKVMFNIETMSAYFHNLRPSLVDRSLIESAKPFHLEGSTEYGVLLVHGYCSNPAEMRELGEVLNNKGYTVEAVLLKGHGTTVRDLTTTDFIDWYESVLQGYDELSKTCTNISILGHSMGGTLSLLLAANRNVDAIISLCAPLDLGKLYHGLPIPILPAFSKFVSKWPKKKSHMKLHDEAGVESYRASSLPGVVEMFDLMEVTREDLKKIEAPLLIVGAKYDYNVPLSNISLLEQVVKSKRVETFTATKSGHSVLFDKDKEEIFQKVVAFLESLKQEEERDEIDGELK